MGKIFFKKVQVIPVYTAVIFNVLLIKIFIAPNIKIENSVIFNNVPRKEINLNKENSVIRTKTTIGTKILEKVSLFIGIDLLFYEKMDFLNLGVNKKNVLRVVNIHFNKVILIFYFVFYTTNTLEDNKAFEVENVKEKNFGDYTGTF